MNTLRTIRLGLWSLLLAGCLALVGLYATIHQTFLSTQGITRVIQQSHVAETVRENVLLPRVLQITQGSDYAPLLDEPTVTRAFNQTVSTEKLTQKLQPAADAVQKWLNNQEATVSFSIPTADLIDSFASSLSSEVHAKIATLPSCTRANSLFDAQNGLCKSSLVTAEALAAKMKEVIASDNTLAQSTTLTPETIGIARLIQQTGSRIPTYLNVLYAASLIAMAILVLGVLWLTYKYRARGIITISVSGILASLALFATSIVGVQSLAPLSTNSQLQQIIRAASNVLSATLQNKALLLFAISLVVLICGIVFLIKQRRTSQKSSLAFSKQPSSN